MRTHLRHLSKKSRSNKDQWFDHIMFSDLEAVLPMFSPGGEHYGTQVVADIFSDYEAEDRAKSRSGSMIDDEKEKEALGPQVKREEEASQTATSATPKPKKRTHGRDDVNEDEEDGRNDEGSQGSSKRVRAANRRPSTQSVRPAEDSSRWWSRRS